MRQPNGLEIFACWILLVQLASRSSIRGVLADEHGNPYSTDDLEVYTDCKKEAFERAIPILVELRWMEYLEQTVYDFSQVASDYQPDATPISPTGQDITEQDKTNKEPNFLPVHDSERHVHRGAVDKAWNAIPPNRQKYRKKFSTNWIEYIIRCDVDGEMVIEKMKLYYETDEGKSKFHRSPHRLIEDEFWNEDISVWGADGGEVKFPSSIFDHDKIIKKYTDASEENQQRFNEMLHRLISSGKHESDSRSRIAYKVWQKYPEYRL